MDQPSAVHTPVAQVRMNVQRLFGLFRTPQDTGSIAEAQESDSSLPTQAPPPSNSTHETGPPCPPRLKFFNAFDPAPKTDIKEKIQESTADETLHSLPRNAYAPYMDAEAQSKTAVLSDASLNMTLNANADTGERTATLHNIAATSKSVLKGIASSVQNAYTNGVTIVTQNRPAFLIQAVDNVEDFKRLQQGKRGVCSACAKIPLDQCFKRPAADSHKSIVWTSHLARVVKHSSWCEFCHLLVEMLSRPEHDPVLNPHVQTHIKNVTLRGVPFGEWVSKGYFDLHANWPFGHKYGVRGDDTNFVTLSQWGVIFGKVSLVVLGIALSAIRFHNTGKATGVRPGGMHKPPEAHQWPLTVHVVVDIAITEADEPGLLTVRLAGHNDDVVPEKATLSEFKLRAVREDSQIAVQPEKPFSYGRILNEDAIDLSMARFWLSECEGKHGSLCGEHGWAAAMTAPDSLRLIDVQDLCLVDMRTADLPRFIALSYVWGHANVLKLQHSNLEQLSLPGALRQQARHIPRTVRDAIEVVRAVNERYLWVDALCIIQDSSEENSDQISKMDQIYGAALFTIVAASGKNAQAGLPGIVRESDIPGETTSMARQVLQPSARMSEEMYVIAPFYRTEDDDVSKSAWATRAWTFQERLLSKRMLIFTSNEMTWHCPKMVCSEDMPVDYSEGFQSSLLWLSLKPRHFGIGAPNWKDGSFEHTSQDSTHLVRTETFVEYASIIHQYSQRTMSYQRDKVNALAGLLRIFSLAFQCECLAGVPTGLLDVALLWRRSRGPLERLSPEFGFPTWSWAGWQGEVVYGSPIRVKLSSYTDRSIETEGIRPLLRYFVLSESRQMLQPLNFNILNTARGIPLHDDDLPKEWEAYHNRSTARDPQLCRLSPTLVQELSPTHLLFYTDAVKTFSLSRIAAVPPATLSQKPFVMLDQDIAYHSIVFNAAARRDMQLIVVAEATGALLVPSSDHVSDYDCYLIMSVQLDGASGVSKRLGLGTVPKAAWYAANPTQTLVCLG